MQTLKFTDKFEALIKLGVQLARTTQADGLLILVDGPTEWARLLTLAQEVKLLIAADSKEILHGAAEAGLTIVALNAEGDPVHDRLSQALLEAVADDLLPPSAKVVAIYSGFDPSEIDSLSVINMGEHLGRLTVRDLRKLESSVPLDTLQTVVNMALEIGREGREGKPVGTLFVVGDSRKVLASSRPVGFDPVKGYARKDRNLKSIRVREGIKEVAQMDGAIIVAPDATVEATARYIDAPAANITLSKGLGTRHWTAAAISRATKAIAVTVSQSNGTVRIFQNGEVVLRIEPFRRPMKWREFEFEPPAAEAS
jgi:DNA integrity scanning protein DisA with diadenylate cyclase activity